MALTKKQTYFAAIAAVAFLLVGAEAWLFLSPFSDKAEGSYVFVDSDDTRDSVFQKLAPLARSGRMMGVKSAASVLRYGNNIRPGRYEVGGGTSTLQLVRNLRGGRQVPVRVVLPVVHTLGDLAARLATQLEPDSAAFMQAFTDSALLAECGLNAETAPTLFLPNTYEVYWNIEPDGFFYRMKKAHKNFWTAKRKAQAVAQGLTPEEVYTLASIVEQETANEKERPMIAGMYLNRLRQGMKLQADPTVKFALGDFKLRRILHTHLTTPSPYNTYLHEGLPPGPICIPSLNAIESVLSPATHTYIYMCAKEDFSGTHNFATTYEEHLRNAKRYADALNARNIR